MGNSVVNFNEFFNSLNDKRKVVAITLYGSPLGEGIIGVVKEETGEEIVIEEPIAIRRQPDKIDIFPVGLFSPPLQGEMRIKKEKIMTIETGEVVRKAYEDLRTTIKANMLGLLGGDKDGGV